MVVAASSEEATAAAAGADDSKAVAESSTGDGGNSSSTARGPGGAAALRALVARKREGNRKAAEERREEEVATTERWSGLKIERRCVRPEKLDACMRAKDIIPLSRVSSVNAASRDQVLIGVLGARPRMSSGATRFIGTVCFGEWVLTDLDLREPHKVTLMLVDRAMEHWSRTEGLGYAQATPGSIFAVLNPSATNRAGHIKVGFETQVLKLGTCPSFAMCNAKTADGVDCREPCNLEGGSTYCVRHANMSHGERCRVDVNRQSRVQQRRTCTQTAGVKARALGTTKVPAAGTVEKMSAVKAPAREVERAEDTAWIARAEARVLQYARANGQSAVEAPAGVVIGALSELSAALESTSGVQRTSSAVLEALGTLALRCTGETAAKAAQLRRQLRSLPCAAPQATSTTQAKRPRIDNGGGVLATAGA